MFKKLPFILIIATILLAFIDHPQTTVAGTCASKCGRKVLQFTPGQRIRLEVVNSTPNIIKLEKLQNTAPIILQPGQKFQLPQENDTQSNLSVVFWNETGLALKGIVSQPNVATLRLEIRPNWNYPGDRTLYILNDGRVNLF